MAKNVKKKKKLNISEGMVNIHSSFNNTIVTLADKSGNTIDWSSGGDIGYKGSKKNTSFAAQLAGKKMGELAVELGISRVGVIVKGPGGGREAAIRALNAAGLQITMIKDVTPVPHNGCRPPKQRRI